MESSNNEKKLLKQNPLASFGFKIVSNEINKLNIAKQQIIDRENEVEKLKTKEFRLQQLEIERVERAKLVRTERNNLNRAIALSLEANKGEEKTQEQKDAEEQQNVYNNIDQAADIETSKDHITMKAKKEWNKRPDNWLDIADHCEKWGMKETLRIFGEVEMNHIKPNNRERNVILWVQNKRDGKNKLSYAVKTPPYGTEVDSQLYIAAQERILLVLTVDPTILRELLFCQFTIEDDKDVNKNNPKYVSKFKLLREHGGQHTFGESWARRFFKRYKLSSRAATTKMRESIPADFAAKENEYMSVAAKYIAKYKVHKNLVIGIDETNALFVSRATRQMVKRGAKRVRVIGVGHEKSQITVTIAAVEGTGELLECQYIFGGKTTRCHPKDNPLPGRGYFTHSESHWQTESTFLEYLEKVIIPYKEKTIHQLGLPPDSYSILKMDLHFTHKTERVKNLLRIHHILPLYVPAGCTDIIQECDTVINKSFKNALKKAFRDYLHQNFRQFITNNPTRRPSEWSPKLTMGELKPMMVSFVEAGYVALQTADMKQAIIKAFQKDGRFEKIRSDDMQLAAMAEIALEINDDSLVIVPEGDEPEVADEDGAFERYDSDSEDEDSEDD